jgi:hypothetical protein
LSGKGNCFDNAPIESFWVHWRMSLCITRTIKQGLQRSMISSAISSCTTWGAISKIKSQILAVFGFL